MNRSIVFFLFFLCAGYVGHAQTSDNGQATSKPFMSDRYVEGLVKADQQRLNLSPDQVPKAKIVWDAYAAKFNEMSKNVTSAADYKAGIRALDLERVSKFKAFLSADQYAQLVATYNKFHPKSPIVP